MLATDHFTPHPSARLPPRIEVLRGAASVLYSEGSTGGAINGVRKPSNMVGKKFFISASYEDTGKVLIIPTRLF